MRVLRILTTCILFVLLILALSFMFLFYTNAGLKSLVQLSPYFIHSEIKFEKISGRLSEGITIRNVSFNNKDIKVSARFVHVNWQPNLLAKHVYIKEFQAEGVNVTLLPTKKSADSAPINPVAFLNQVKRHLTIDNVHVTELSLYSDQERLAKLDSIFLQKHTQGFHASISGTVNGFALSGVSEIRASNDALQFQQTVLKLDDNELKLSGSYGNQLSLNWQFTIDHLNKIYSKAKGNLYSSGSVTGSIQQPKINADFKVNQLRLPEIGVNKLIGHIDASLPSSAKIRLDLMEVNVKDYRLPLINWRSETNLINKNLNTQFDVALNKDNQVSGNIMLPNFTSFANVSQPLRGNIQIRMRDLHRFISIPEVKNLTGMLTGNVLLNGQLNQPLYEAKLNILEGSVTIPKLGVTYTFPEINAHTRANQAILIRGTAFSGKGSLQISGSINPYEAQLPIELKFAGSDFTLSNTREYKIEVTPDLTLFYDRENIRVQGSLLVPHAVISPKNFANITELPSEVEIVGEKPPEPLLPMNLSLKVQLQLGDSILIAYQNLKAKLAGNLDILQTPGTPATAIGELYTREGSYTAYGKVLKITEGRLIYTGNVLTNPGLAIRAMKSIRAVGFANASSQFNDDQAINRSVYTGSRDIQVGVAVNGTISSPKISLISEPSMGQNDILSYLVFGYPSSQVSGASSLALLASLGANLNSSSNATANITDGVQKLFGLTNFSIGTTNYYANKNDLTSTSATTVNVGKNIGDKLSLNYSVGIFDSVSIFSVRYQINKFFSLQSETSSIDTGADVFYEIERD